MKVSTISLLKCFAIVALVGVSVFSAPQKTLASSMNGYFSETNASGDFTTQQTLKLEYDPAGGVSENQVVFTVHIKPTDITTPGDIPQADPTTKKLLTFHFDGGTNENSATPHGIIDTQANLGYWDSIFSNTLDSGNGTTGIYLDLKKKDDISPYCLTTGFYTSGCFSDSAVHTPYPLIHYLLKNDGSNKMRMLGTDITFNIQMNDLSPDTYYQARIRIEEDDSTDVGSSALVTFRTKPAGSGSLSGTQETHEAGGQAIIDETTNLPSCGVFGESSSIMGCVAQIVYYVIFQPTAYVMTLAGEIMDWGIGYSIDSNSYPTTGDTFVTKGWRIMRDLSNMLFIFVLLYIAIATILDLSGVNTGKMIGTVIIVALLINFSLFFVKIIVDAGNIMTRLFYNQVSVKNSGTGAEITGTAGYKSISYGFAAKFNPTSLFSIVQKSADGGSVGGVTAGNATLSSALTPSQFAGFYALFSFIGAIVNLVAAFVFFSLAWLFVGRVIAIWLMMIFAPLVFIFYTLPKGATSAIPSMLNPNKYWTDLIKQSFMPVMAMLMIFLILSFLNTNIVQGIAGATTTTGKFMAVLVPLMLITMLLLATKKTATEMSGMVAEYAGKVGSFVGGAAVGIATGGAAMALRGTVGRAAMGVANSEKVKEAASKGGVGGWAARNLVYNPSKSIQGASFDARKTAAGGAASSFTGMKFDQVLKTKEGGFKKEREEYVKNQQQFAKGLEVGEDSKLKQEQYRKEEILKDVQAEKKRVEKEGFKKGSDEWDKAEKARKSAEQDLNKTKDEITKINTQRKNQYADSLKNDYIETEMTKKLAEYGGKGAVIGGMIGSVVPGVGTALGLAVGAGAGVLSKASFSEKGRQEAVNKIRAGAKLPKEKGEVDPDAIGEAVKKALAKEEKEKEEKDEKKDDKGTTPTPPGAVPTTPAPGYTSSSTSEVKETTSTTTSGTATPPPKTGGTPTGSGPIIATTIVSGNKKTAVAGASPTITQAPQATPTQKPAMTSAQPAMKYTYKPTGTKPQDSSSTQNMGDIFKQPSGSPKILNIQMPSAGQVNIQGMNTKPTPVSTERPTQGGENTRQQAQEKPVVTNEKMDRADTAAKVAGTVGKKTTEDDGKWMNMFNQNTAPKKTTDDDGKWMNSFNQSEPQKKEEVKVDTPPPPPPLNTSGTGNNPFSNPTIS